MMYQPTMPANQMTSQTSRRYHDALFGCWDGTIFCVPFNATRLCQLGALLIRSALEK